MELNTYSDLLAEVADWLNKTNLTARIPSFVRLAEAQMNRELECRELEETIRFAVTEEVGLPCGFRTALALRLETSPPVPLTYVDAAFMDRPRDQGRPEFFTVSGDSLIFAPSPDGPYTARLRYRKDIEPLGTANPCNWLLDKHPDAYLYGALMQAAPYLRDDERMAVWGQLYRSAIDAINGDDKHRSAKTNARGRQL